MRPSGRAAGPVLKSPHPRHDVLQIRVQRLLMPGRPQGDVDFLGAGGDVLAEALDGKVRGAQERAIRDARAQYPPVLGDSQALPLHVRAVDAEIEHQVDGTLDGARVAVFLLAPVVEHLIEAAELSGRQVGGVPAVGMGGGNLERALFAGTADPDG